MPIPAGSAAPSGLALSFQLAAAALSIAVASVPISSCYAED